jgi:hypothetical protein
MRREHTATRMRVCQKTQRSNEVGSLPSFMSNLQLPNFQSHPSPPPFPARPPRPIDPDQGVGQPQTGCSMEVVSSKSRQLSVDIDTDTTGVS